MADGEQLTLLRQGSGVWNAWRQAHPRASIDLTRADLTRVDLSRADFSGVDLRGADFTGTILVSADFRRANSGLQFHVTLGLIVLGFLLAGVAGLLTAFSGAFIGYVLSPAASFQGIPIPGLLAILTMIGFFGLTVFRGLTAAFVAIGVQITLSVLAAVGISAGLYGVEAAARTGAISVAGVVAVFTAIAAVALSSFSVCSVAALSGVIPAAATMGAMFVTALVVAFEMAPAVASAGAFAITGDLRRDAIVHGCVVGAGAAVPVVALLGAYFARRIWDGDSQYALIRSAAASFLTMGGTSFRKTDLTDANFENATLPSTDFRSARLLRTRWQHARQLDWARLGGTYLHNPTVRQLVTGADGHRRSFAHLDLRGLNLSGVNLRDADFSGSILEQGTLQGADLRGADLRQANLVDANLDAASLTEARLWESQRTRWSVQGISCETAYWDEHARERTTYRSGEFERLYADKTKIVIYYEGGLDPIEITTLPALVLRIEARYPNCALRLGSIQAAPSGATVTLLVEDGGGRDPEELRRLKAEIEHLAQRVIGYQRTVLEERTRRQEIEAELEILYEKVVPRIFKGLAMERSGDRISITGGTIHGNVIGAVNDHARVVYNNNDLASIRSIVDEMLSHLKDLPFAAPEHARFETQLKTAQKEASASAPNHTVLREALHTVRHMLEAGVAHVLVGQWLAVLQTMV